MDFERILEPHAVVGLDCDETLINGPYSHDLLTWCKEHHVDKDLHVITFREYAPYRDLANFGYDVNWFTFHCLPRDISISYRQALPLFHQSSDAIEKKLREGLLTQESWQQCRYAVMAFREWKGSICHAVGASVLVDDLPLAVLPGCRKYGITFVAVK